LSLLGDSRRERGESMTLVQLESDAKVNVREIDAQHEHLIALLNQLHDAMMRQEDTDTLGRVLSELIDYTQTHFRYEEQLMSEYDYPRYASHKAAHEKLMQHIVGLAEGFRSGEILLSFAIMVDLKGWAITHIEQCDKPLGAFLNTRKVF
jgi:hemerythrin